MVSPKIAYKGLREELRLLVVAGDFLNSGSGLVSLISLGCPRALELHPEGCSSFQPGSSAQLF